LDSCGGEAAKWAREVGEGTKHRIGEGMELKRRFGGAGGGTSGVAAGVFCSQPQLVGMQGRQVRIHWPMTRARL
jgi:hypothetical protein